jgi:long-chain acyl-CoA synthetase
LPGVNLADRMIASVDGRRTKVALAATDAEMSYHALAKGSARLGALLTSRGLLAGDRIAMMLPNVPEFATVYYGILRMGGVVVTVDPAAGEPDIACALAGTDARLLFAWASAAEPAEAAARAAGADAVFVAPGEFDRVLLKFEPDNGVCQRGSDDAAAIEYLGKGATTTASVVTHGEAIADALALSSACGLSHRDVTLGALPLSQYAGQAAVLNATLFCGGGITLMAQFDVEETLALIARAGVTFFPAAPAMWANLSEHAGRLTPGCPLPRVCVLEQQLSPNTSTMAFR